MVARGTFTELQGSGLDFTSLLKKDEEDEVEGKGGTEPAPGTLTGSPHTLSQSSMPSLSSSSMHSVIEGVDQPEVGNSVVTPSPPTHFCLIPWESTHLPVLSCLSEE